MMKILMMIKLRELALLRNQALIRRWPLLLTWSQLFKGACSWIASSLIEAIIFQDLDDTFKGEEDQFELKDANEDVAEMVKAVNDSLHQVNCLIEVRRCSF